MRRHSLTQPGHEVGAIARVATACLVALGTLAMAQEQWYQLAYVRALEPAEDGTEVIELVASGPVAFERLDAAGPPATTGDAPGPSPAMRVRLYGVTRGSVSARVAAGPGWLTLEPDGQGNTVVEFFLAGGLARAVTVRQGRGAESIRLVVAPAGSS